MIIATEQAALKVQHQFDALRDFVDRAARDGQRIDTVERELFRQLLGVGNTLLSTFVAQKGVTRVHVDPTDFAILLRSGRIFARNDERLL